YCIPEFPERVIRTCAFNSKSATSPSCQTRKVFLFMETDGVVSPIILPFSARHTSIFPDQPSKVSPLNMETKPSSSASERKEKPVVTTTIAVIKTIGPNDRKPFKCFKLYFMT